MRHQLRNYKRGISDAEALELLARGEYGVLSTCAADGQPYGIPLSYAVIDNGIYFHCAVEGHKLENLAANNNVSFCIVGKTEVLPDQFATRYESVIATGLANEVFAEEKQRALVALVAKYSADFMQQGLHYIDEASKATKVFRIDIKTISGKARR